MTTCYSDKKDTVKCSPSTFESNVRFNNLNLNHGSSSHHHQNSEIRSVKSFSTTSSTSSHGHQKTYFNDDIVYSRNNKQLALKKSKTDKKDIYKFDDEKENGKKESKLNETSNSSNKNKNGSTLSLYIAAYEAKIEEDLVKEKEAFKGDAKVYGKPWKSIKITNYNATVKQYPFEIPRSNENESTQPEIMQFKASQKLLNPNASSNFSGNDQNSHSSNDINMEVDSPNLNPILTIPGTMDIGIGKPIILLDFVKRVFRSWPGYQLAIQHQLGGSSTAEIHEWLCQTTTEYVEGSPQLDRDSLAEWLDEIFDNEFQLVLDDGSTDVFSNVILKGAKLLREGPAEEMKKQWDALKEEGGQISKANGGEESSSSGSEDDGEGKDDDDDEAMDIDDKPSKQPKGSRFVEGDDGWTQVCRR